MIIILRTGIVGAGRMGSALAGRLANNFEVLLFDNKPDHLVQAAARLSVQAAAGIEEIAAADAVILAVPDREVTDCIKDLNGLKQAITVFNVATNVAHGTLTKMACSQVKCTSVKFVGHALEIANGARPFIIINEQPADLVPLAQEIFSCIGEVMIGKADMVTVINTIAAEKVLEAAVRIEDALKEQQLTQPALIKSAIEQVAAGIIRGYANNNLGPFAREIEQAVKARQRR